MPEKMKMKIFALFTKTTKNSIKMYKKLERNTIYQFWYRNFAQGDVHISFGGKI